MNTRPTSRINDEGLKHRAAILYHDFGTPSNKDVQAVLAYVEFRPSGLPIIRVLGCRMHTAGDQIRIGGSTRSSVFKNASIGRRVCPNCWNPAQPAQIRGRGAHVGTCRRCSVKADTLLTSLRPYFYYFHATEMSMDQTITDRDPALMIIADKLKSALLTQQQVVPMVLPKLDSEGIVCDLDAVTVFEYQGKSDLKGHTDAVKYNFWSHPQRQSQHNQRMNYRQGAHR